VRLRIISVNVKTYQLTFSSTAARIFNPRSDIRPSPTTSGYPNSKCLFHVKETASNGVGKGKTYFASEVRGTSKNALSLSSTQIGDVDHGGSVGERVGGVGVGRPEEEEELELFGHRS
jgi:hypothetical protein